MERKKACEFIITNIEEVLSNPFTFKIQGSECSKNYDPNQESQLKISIIESLVNFLLAGKQYSYIRFKWKALEKMKTIEVHINMDTTWSIVRLSDIPYKKDIFTANDNSVIIQVLSYDDTSIRRELMICDLTLQKISPSLMKPSEEQQKIEHIIAKYCPKKGLHENNEEFLPKLKLTLNHNQFQDMVFNLEGSFASVLDKAKTFIEGCVEKCPNLFEESTLCPEERSERLSLLHKIYNSKWKGFYSAFNHRLERIFVLVFSCTK